jgi:hypothetical protein
MALEIPAFPEDRGPIKVDPKTGSTLQKETAYCKDLKGCGDKDFTVLSQAMSINKCATDGSCQREFVASVSINIIMDGDLPSSDVGVLIDYIKDNLEAAHLSCP